MKDWLTHYYRTHVLSLPAALKLGLLASGVATIAFTTGFVLIRPLQQVGHTLTRSPAFAPRTATYAQQVTQSSQQALADLSVQALPVILQAAIDPSDRRTATALNPLGEETPNHLGFVADSFVAPPPPRNPQPAAVPLVPPTTMTADADPYRSLNLPRL